MAARINTRFVLILLMFCMCGAAVVGAFAYLQVRGDATRNVRVGDEAAAIGDYELARSAYGRAVRKDPGNAENVRKFEHALLQIRPVTADQARNLYRERLGILNHVVEYNPTDTEAHLKLLRELHRAARRSAGSWGWDMLVDAANTMWNKLPLDDPKRYHAKVYRAIGKLNLASARPEELNSGVEDITEAIEHLQEHDLAWATMITAQFQVAEKMRLDRLSQITVDEQFEKLDQSLQRALKFVPNGTEVALVHLQRLLHRRSSDLDSVGEDELASAAEKLLSLLDTVDSSELISDAINVLTQVPGNYPDRAVEFVSRYIDDYPNAYDLYMTLAQLHLSRREYERCKKLAMEVMESETLPVSLMGQFQFEARKHAAGMLVDIDYAQWASADQLDRHSYVESMEKSLAKLRNYIPDQQNDPIMLRAKGKVAFAKGNFIDAASFYEQLVKQSLRIDDHLFSAAILQQLGQIGLAHERLAQVTDALPANSALRIEKANLEVQMGRHEQTRQTLVGLSDSMRDDPRVKAILNEIDRGQIGKQVKTDDPVQLAVQEAGWLIEQGEIETASATLVSALNEFPEDQRLLQFLTDIEIRSGNREQAKVYLDRAKQSAPDSVMLRRLEARLNHEDPIDALIEFHMSAPDDEIEKLSSMLVDLMTVFGQQVGLEQQYSGQGNTEKAEGARALADRILGIARKYGGDLQNLDPDHPRLIDFRFQTSLIDKDWDAAKDLIAYAKSHNTDNANGMLYKGRYHMVRDEYQEAVHSLEAAVDRVGYSSTVWRALGLAYRSLGNFSQALRAYQEAYRRSPNDINAAKEYIQLLYQGDEKNRALQVLRDIHPLVPNDVRIREKWLDLEAEVGNFATALNVRSVLYSLFEESGRSMTPIDRANARGLATLLGQNIPNPSVILDSEGNQQFTDQQWARMPDFERQRIVDQVAAKWRRQADKIIDRLVADASEEELLGLTVLRASLLHSRGDVAEGENLLLEHIAMNSDPEPSSEMLIALGRYQKQSKHFTEAIDTFEEALQYQDPEQREADRELASLYGQLRQFEKALTHLDNVLAISPGNNIATFAVDCLIQLDRFDEAEQRLNALIDDGIENYVTTMLGASIDEGRAEAHFESGNTEQAQRMLARQRDALARAEQQAPGDPKPRTLLAQSFFKEYQHTRRPALLEDALWSLDRASVLSESHPEISLLRVTILEEMDRHDAAIGELRRLVERNPDHIGARRQLMRLYLKENDYDAAIRLTEDAIRVNPTVWVWHEARGDLYRFQKNDPKTAAAAYETAYDLSLLTTVLLKLADAKLAESPPDCVGTVATIENDREKLDHSSRLRQYYARALNCLDRRDDALEQARLSFYQLNKSDDDGPAPLVERTRWFELLPFLFADSDPRKGIDVASAEEFVLGLVEDEPAVHTLWMLGNVWMLKREEGTSRALELFQQAAEKCPSDNTELRIVINSDLAGLLVIIGDHQRAVDVYKEITELEPDHIVALNNLAYLYVDALSNPTAAIEFAERLVELGASSADVFDTVGWVYFKNNQADVARDYLTRSVELQPSASAYVHLAEVAIAMGDSNDAGRFLDEATKLRAVPQTQQRIEQLRDDIGK